MIISIDAEKDLTKLKLIYHKKKKKSPEMGFEASYFSIIKEIYEKPTTNIIINDGKLKAFPLKSGTRQGAHSHHFYST